MNGFHVFPYEPHIHIYCFCTFFHRSQERGTSDQVELLRHDRLGRRTDTVGFHGRDCVVIDFNRFDEAHVASLFRDNGNFLRLTQKDHGLSRPVRELEALFIVNQHVWLVSRQPSSDLQLHVHFFRYAHESKKKPESIFFQPS